MFSEDGLSSECSTITVLRDYPVNRSGNDSASGNAGVGLDTVQSSPLHVQANPKAMLPLASLLDLQDGQMQPEKRAPQTGMGPLVLGGCPASSANCEEEGVEDKDTEVDEDQKS